MADLNTPNNSLHRSEQRARNVSCLLSLGKVHSQIEDLLRNPESIVAWQIAEGNATSLLRYITEARIAEEEKRREAIEREFNSKNLFSYEVAR